MKKLSGVELHYYATYAYELFDYDMNKFQYMGTHNMALCFTCQDVQKEKELSITLNEDVLKISRMVYSALYEHLKKKHPQDTVRFSKVTYHLTSRDELNFPKKAKQ